MFVYEESIGTKMNDLDLCLQVVSRSRQSSTIALHSTLNISETVTCFVPKDHQYEMAYGVSNGQVTLKGQTRDPNTLRAQYLENGWR